MKKIINAIIQFFVRIWIFLFGSKKEETPIKEQKGDNYGQIQYVNNPITPVHNNRRNTHGRYVQYITLASGRTRAIYHGAK